MRALRQILRNAYASHATQRAALRAMRVLRKIIRKHFACVALSDFRNARNARSAGTLCKI